MRTTQRAPQNPQQSSPRTWGGIGARRPWTAAVLPPCSASSAGWVLLPLRAFLGVTFTFAGLQKLANPGFFTASNPASIQAQLAAAARLSPVHVLLRHVVHLAVPIGVVIALAEIAIGLGTLLGVWTRLALLGGLVLSFSLFLTVSFHSSPYYTGADIVFVFAWLPMIVAGAGGVLSADALIADHVRARQGVAPEIVVSAPFVAVQRRAAVSTPAAAAPCTGRRASPGRARISANPRPRSPGPDREQIDRRTFALKGGVAAAVAGVGLLGAGLASAIGRIAGGDSHKSTVPTLPGAGPPTSTTTSGAGRADVDAHVRADACGHAHRSRRRRPGRGSASFQDPSSGDPSLVIQPRAGTFLAFDAVCPHAGCIVGYGGRWTSSCAHATARSSTARPAAVELGPATRGLTRITVAEGPDGELYAT